MAILGLWQMQWLCLKGRMALEVFSRLMALDEIPVNDALMIRFS